MKLTGNIELLKWKTNKKEEYLSNIEKNQRKEIEK